jgi:hypothetical protein
MEFMSMGMNLMGMGSGGGNDKGGSFMDFFNPEKWGEGAIENIMKMFMPLVVGYVGIEVALKVIDKI